VLVGQPELRHHLSDHSLRQLNQRIAVRYQLRPLNREETSSYILHRLNIAGRPDGNIFSPAALKKVFHCSAGVPRKINLICDRALLTAYSEERGVVSASDVTQAVRELAGMGEGSQSSPMLPWKAVLAATFVLFFVLAGVYWLAPLDRQPEVVAVLKSEQVASTDRDLKQTAESATGSEVRTTLSPASLIESCNALLSLWDVQGLDKKTNPANLDLEREFARRGFELARFAGRIDELTMFKLPVLLPVSEAHGGGYLAVLDQVAPGQWSVSPAYDGRKSLSTKELERIGIGMALLPWIDFASIGYVAVPGMKGENVRRLQFMLGLAGCADIPTNGRYDASSINCVKNFQREHGLVVDGLVGPRTLILLYQAAGAYNMPRMSS
jgi:general secretion pathway protein A